MFKPAYAAAALTAVLAAAPAAAQSSTADANENVSSLVVFGDSLVDAGNANTRNPAAANAAQGYFDGRFTNGYDYTDLLSIALFGTPTVASLEGGTNFGFGGARATTTSFVPDLNEQLAQYQGFLAAGGMVDPTGLYVLNFGGNDVFAALAPGAPAGYASDSAFLLDAATNYARAIQTLGDLGATNFLITGFPVAVPQSLEAEGYLFSALGALQLGAGVNVNFFSYLDFFNRLSSDPTQFGLPADLNLTTNCQAAGAVPGCEGYFYFDTVHPTAAIHQAAFGDIQRQFGFAAAGAIPEPGSWALMIVGFGFAGAAMRRRQRRAVRVAYA